MAETRIIEGIITNWETKTGKATYLVAEIDGQKYNFFKPRDAELEATFSVPAPIGSKVQFSQTKNEKYWNYKDGTFKVLAKSTAPAQPQGTSTTTNLKGNMFSSDNYWRNKDKREEDNEAAYAFMRCLDAACAVAKIDITEMGDVTDLQSAKKLMKNNAQVDKVISIADAFFTEVQRVKRKAIEAKRIMAEVVPEVQDAMDEDII